MNGFIEDILDKHRLGDGCRRIYGMIVPGFINCHCHLELSHLRGLIPEKQV